MLLIVKGVREREKAVKRKVEGSEREGDKVRGECGSMSLREIK